MAKKKRQSAVRKATRKKPEQQLNFVEEKPDPDEEDFVYDDVEKFHRKRERDILGDDQSDLSSDDFDEEEEVLGVDDASTYDSDEEEEDMEGEDGSDLDNGIPSSQAWGKQKSAYFGAEKLDGLQGFDRDAVQDEEEEEALRTQQRLAGEIDEDQFDLFPSIVESKAPTVTEKYNEADKVPIDVSGLSEKAQWKLLKREAPELKDLIADFKLRSAEVITCLAPLMELVKQNKIEGSAGSFVKTSYNLHLSYLMNISFYMALKSKRIPVQSHPVIKRLVEFRTLLNRLQPIRDDLDEEINTLLQTKNCPSDGASGEFSDEEMESEHEEASESEIDSDDAVDLPAVPAKADTNEKDSNRSTAIKYYTALQERLLKSSEEKEASAKNQDQKTSTESPDHDDRRAITYSMDKNEGIKGKKRKLDQNPRVKHREKFRKAKIKRKSQVRIHRPEIQKYAGEMSGIRAGVIRSVRIK